MTDKNNDPTPAEALDAIRHTQTSLADSFSRDSWGYDLTYSLGAGVMVGGMGLPMPYNFAIFAVAALGLVLLARNWADRHGVWISGVTPRRARWIAVLLGLALAGLMAVNLLAANDGGWLPPGVKPWFPLMTGFVAAGLALRGSRLWRTVYRRENGLQP